MRREKRIIAPRIDHGETSIHDASSSRERYVVGERDLSRCKKQKELLPSARLHKQT